MKKINTHSHKDSRSTSVGSFTVILKAVFGFVFIFTTGILAPSHALAWDCTLSASSPTITEGSSSTLSWTTINSTSFSINNGVGAVTPVPAGSVTVSPTITTTYTGTALGSEGSITCKTTITVTPKLPPPPAPPTCTISASPTSIQEGSPSTLSWTTTNATTFTIDNAVGSVTPVASSSTSVSPTTTTTYTGTATGPGGSATCPATVTVTTTPPTCHTYSSKDGKITGSVNKGNAILTIPANVCPVKVSFSSYNLPDGKILPYSHQVLYDNITNTYGPGTHNVGPLKLACNWQTDLYLGSVQTTIGQYGTQGLIAYDDLTGQTCQAPPPAPPTCTISASPTSIQEGSPSTLSWTTTNATSFSLNQGVGVVTPVISGSTSVSPTTTTTYTGTATGPGGSATCPATVTVTTTPPPPPPPPPGCTSSCGGGGGGGDPLPHVSLTPLPHVSSLPLAYLYLSQIPYTGLDLGPVGTVVYWVVLVVLALALAYLVLFWMVPLVDRSVRNFSSHLKEALNAQELAYASYGPVAPLAGMPEPAVSQQAKEEDPYEAPRGYSTFEGFKSFAHNGALSIDDIVKGLAYSHSVPLATVEKRVEPVYEHTEPIYENTEAVRNDTIPETVPASAAPTHARGFIAALIEGDRSAVFAGLRQYVRGAGTPEKLMSETACLLDDVYRARIDGTSSDADLTRLVARLDTPTLEKLVASLTTAIDSSYTISVTGAKLALTRALAVIGGA